VDWLALWENGLLRTAALCGAIAVVWAGLRWVGRKVRGVVRAWRAVLPRIRVAVNIIERELTSNGGSSVKDQMTSLNGRVGKLEEGQHELAALQTEAMALTEKHRAHDRAQLSALGIDIADLPDARVTDRRHRPTTE
jgi:hypothetical protein